jgi:hypothetical protein
MEVLAVRAASKLFAAAVLFTTFLFLVAEAVRVVMLAMAVLAATTAAAALVPVAVIRLF